MGAAGVLSVRRVYVIDPMAKARPRVTSRGTFMPTKYTNWKATCAWLGVVIEDEVGVEFVIAMPRSWSKKKRAEMDGVPHRSTPDLDNLLGGLMDAARKDDSGVHRVMASKRWGECGLIEVWPLVT